MPTATGQNSPLSIFSAISFASKKYGRSSKGTFLSRITRFGKTLRNLGLSQFARSTWQSNLSKLQLKCHPALYPLGKDMRALWTKKSEVENNRHLRGAEQSKFPSAVVSA